MSFSEQVLRWMLKRHEQDGSIPVRCDLVNVRAHPALEPLPTQALHGGRTWKVVAVHGELSLRRALLDGVPVIAVLPDAFSPPLDLNDRAYRRQVLKVEAQDLVAAASQRFSVRIRDAVLADAILKAPEVLAKSSAAWTLGPSKTTVTEDEIRSVLLAAALGFEHKLERHAPEALLAKWLAEPVPQSDLTGLLAEQLKRTFGSEGEWLAQALEPGGIAPLVAAGSLAATSQGRRAAQAFLTLEDDRAWGRLRTLVERAVRSAGYGRLSSEARRGLEEAQGRFHRLRAEPSEAVRFPLLEGALETALTGLMQRCAAGEAPSGELIDALGRSLHKDRHAAGIRLVEVSARLVRFGQLELDEDVPAAEWLERAKEHGAWADLLARELRRLRAEVSADLARFADRVVARYLELRDQWNAAFAERLVGAEAAVYSARDRRAPISLADVSRLLVRPLVEARQRVFLAVLDGCDLSTFIELLRGWTETAPLGLGLPPVGGALGDDLRATGPLLLGVSPLPTLTVHARRALFAGEIPKNPILDERDAVAANAAADHRAFRENLTLGDIPRRLLLKDEVGMDGAEVRAALDDPGLDVVAAVFNGVDDALSSHETTPFPAWRWSTVGGRLPEVLLHALDRGWTVLVTADHGHTPFWDPARRAEAGGSGGHRWRREPFPGGVELAGGQLRPEPLYALSRTGAWFGPQSRGYHGGVSLEEVAVPLAFLARQSGRIDEWLPPPGWWDGEPTLEGDEAIIGSAPSRPARPAWDGVPMPAPTEPERPSERGRRPSGVTAPPSSPVPVPGPSPLPASLRGEISDIAQAEVVLSKLADKGQISQAQLGGMVKRPGFLVGGILSKVESRLHAAGKRVPFDEEQRQGEPWYIWKGTGDG